MEKWQLIQDTHHRRDRAKGIDAYIQTVAAYFEDIAQSTAMGICIKRLCRKVTRT